VAKDDAFWLNAAYIVFLLLTAYVTFKAAETIGIQTGWLERFEWFHYAAYLVSGAAGVGAAWALRADPARNEYFLAAIGELRKVAWPSWPDTKRMTLVVCIVVGIFAVIVGVFDFFWSWTLKHLIA